MTGDKIKPGLVFLKLGGSLITDKNTPRTSRPDLIDQAVSEIQAALSSKPDLRLLLGHGSGSFGHYSGQKHGTRQGVSSREQWLGFAEVWQDAASLNIKVMEALQKAGVAAISFPPSASLTAEDRQITSWDLSGIHRALDENLVPVVYGDVVFDTRLGGTILSTEELFDHLARELKPELILLAGIEPGVWQDYPACTSLLESISSRDLADHSTYLTDSRSPDVTGGMELKVKGMVELVSNIPGLEGLVFSGLAPGNIYQALCGKGKGTRLIP